MTIEHRTGSLFDAQSVKGSILAHACNAKGVWGSGIAKQFKERFPHQFNAYSFWCRYSAPHVHTRVGSTLLVHDNVFDVTVACMITSEGYGKDVDSPTQILEATDKAFRDLLSQISPPVTIHMPRINSGLFNVPWADTQAVLEQVMESFPDTRVIVSTP